MGSIRCDFTNKNLAIQLRAGRVYQRFVPGSKRSLTGTAHFDSGIDFGVSGLLMAPLEVLLILNVV